MELSAAPIDKSECDALILDIEPAFDMAVGGQKHKFYNQMIREALSTILSGRMEFVQSDDPDVIADVRDQFLSLLPLVTSMQCEGVPGNISFYFLAKYRANSFKFFFQMISRWLLSGRRLNVVLMYAADFRLPKLGNEIYTICELMIRVEDLQEFEQILNNFPIIETEIKLGIASEDHARRILETRGLTLDVKTAMIQEHVAYLIQRLPAHFDQNILTEMQHVLVMCSDDFKAVRQSRHLSRIISLHYLYRKALREAIKQAPQKRHLYLKLFRARLNEEERERAVLAFVVGVNFFRDKEVFEKAHLLKAIQNYIPTAQAVENSFFANRRGSEPICTLYLEIEKSDGEEFTNQEIKTLLDELPCSLKDRIEHLMHPVFMTRNEEEIMRNILSLSSQIKYVRDIPQVFISFDEQTHTDLFFTIILVRVLKKGSISIQEMFKQSDAFFEYIHDRCKLAGTLRRKYEKEATVFRVRIPKDSFLRVNHSIDINKARQAIVLELCRVIGEVRDFNGGMISKQNEVLCQLRDLLRHNAKSNDLLLENFFYSLTPVIMRNVLEPEVLCTLFEMLLDSIDAGFANGEGCALKIYSEGYTTYVMIKSEDRSLKDELHRALAKLQLHSSQLTSSAMSVHDYNYLGYIYRNDDLEMQALFRQTIQTLSSSR